MKRWKISATANYYTLDTTCKPEVVHVSKQIYICICR